MISLIELNLLFRTYYLLLRHDWNHVVALRSSGSAGSSRPPPALPGRGSGKFAYLGVGKVTMYDRLIF